jgi:hypothetical protein
MVGESDRVAVRMVVEVHEIPIGNLQVPECLDVTAIEALVIAAEQADQFVVRARIHELQLAVSSRHGRETVDRLCRRPPVARPSTPIGLHRPLMSSSTESALTQAIVSATSRTRHASANSAA